MPSFENLVISHKNSDFLENLLSQGLFSAWQQSTGTEYQLPWDEAGGLWIISTHLLLMSPVWPWKHLSWQPSLSPPNAHLRNGLLKWDSWISCAFPLSLSPLTQHFAHLGFCFSFSLRKLSMHFWEMERNQPLKCQKTAGATLLLTWRCLDFPRHVLLTRGNERENGRLLGKQLLGDLIEAPGHPEDN